MFLSIISKFYKKHKNFFIKMLEFFVFSHSLRTYIKMVLEYEKGPEVFLKQSKILKEKYQTETKYFLSIVAIIKNEAPYLPEWIEYHRINGVEKFYLYDNDSTDNTKETLKPYIKKGIVEYTFFPGDKKQLPAYKHFLKNYGKETKWAAIIDLDEFIVSKKDSLINFLSKNDNVPQILVPWVNFGSNGHTKKPNGLVIENYTKRAAKPRLYKGIIKPQLTLKIWVHKHDVAGRTSFPKMDTIMINHYYCKSLQEYKKRATRGDALCGKKFAKKTFNEKLFYQNDINDIYDPFVLQYKDEIKKRLKHIKTI